MKKIIVIIIACLILASFVSGGVYYFLSNSSKNCNNDHTCLTDSLRSCTKAKGTSITNTPRENYIEIQGLENNQCKIYIKNLENKEMTCLISYENYEGYDSWGGYNVWINQDGIRASALSSCSGTLKDSLESQVANIVTQNPSTQKDKMEVKF